MIDFATGLHIFWFCVFISSIVFYSVLDGFDLGVGILHLFQKGDAERRVCLNAIGPVWDGNEVWLVILVGGLFAGFPGAYATLFSAFYLPTTIFIAALIFRAVAIEFRSKHESPLWRKTWDVCFFLGSLMIAFGAGIVLGNLISGIPLDSEFEYVGTFSYFFRPYPLLIGVLAISCFTMHGSIYLAMKTEGEMHERMRRLIPFLIIGFIIIYFGATIFTLTLHPKMIDRLLDHPALFSLAGLSLLAILNTYVQVKKRNDGYAFISSCLCIALLLILFAIGLYPNLVYSTIDPEHNSVTVFNAGSSEMTLIVLAIIVGIGLPLVFVYGFLLYRIFRGKVKMDKMSY